MAQSPPPPDRFVSYLRVSTAQQGRSGLGLDAQRQVIAEYLDRSGGTLIGPEFVEVESGRKATRPLLQEAIAHAKKNRAILLVAKLDRLARSVSFVSALQQAGIKFRAADMPEANEFMVHILSAVAEYERKMISERTKAGLAQARQRGTILGNRRLIDNGYARNWNRRQQATARQAAERLHPVIASLMAQGIRSLTGIAQALNAGGHTTATGGTFYPQTVKRLISRIPMTAGTRIH